MLSRNLIPLVAETVNAKPRGLGLASPAEKLIIKAFRYHLSQKLQTAVEITFAVADKKLDTLTIGFMPLEFRETAECKKAAAEVIECIRERVKTKFCVEATLAGIPNNGLLLLYDFTQAYDIARNLSISDFATVQFAYTACLHYASTDDNAVDAEKWLDVLCEFAKKCISNGAWRPALLCLDQGEDLVNYLFQTFDSHLKRKEELIEALIKLGDCFEFADLPERAIELSKKLLPRLEQLAIKESAQDEAELLDTTILRWQKSSAEMWQENAPLLCIARDFAKKIA
jgi:hypothetical protein